MRNIHFAIRQKNDDLVLVIKDTRPILNENDLHIIDNEKDQLTLIELVQRLQTAFPRNKAEMLELLNPLPECNPTSREQWFLETLMLSFTQMEKYNLDIQSKILHVSDANIIERIEIVLPKIPHLALNIAYILLKFLFSIVNNYNFELTFSNEPNKNIENNDFVIAFFLMFTTIDTELRDYDSLIEQLYIIMLYCLKRKQENQSKITDHETMIEGLHIGNRIQLFFYEGEIRNLLKKLLKDHAADEEIFFNMVFSILDRKFSNNEYLNEVESQFQCNCVKLLIKFIKYNDFLENLTDKTSYSLDHPLWFFIAFANFELNSQGFAEIDIKNNPAYQSFYAPNKDYFTSFQHDISYFFGELSLKHSLNQDKIVFAKESTNQIRNWCLLTELPQNAFYLLGRHSLFKKEVTSPKSQVELEPPTYVKKV